MVEEQLLSWMITFFALIFSNQGLFWQIDFNPDLSGNDHGNAQCEWVLFRE